MQTKLIRFCPRCGGQSLDRAVFRSEYRARCNECQTTFTIDSVVGRNDTDSAIKDRSRTTRRHRRGDGNPPVKA
ncbi:MAG: hypothetical protein HZA54_13860 [Planctomycetes bacterium]|nr:hypothetical protein [Planctomycetota bacterium]